MWHESRCEALTYYQSFFRTPHSPSYIYVNFTIDTIKLADGIISYVDGEERDGIRKLELAVEDAAYFGHYNLETISKMQGLQELELVATERDRSSWQPEGHYLMRREKPDWCCPRVRLVTSNPTKTHAEQLCCQAQKERERQAALMEVLHPYAEHPAAIPSPDMSSRLLSLPKEVRLEIYRYLLLPSKYVSIEAKDPILCRGEYDDGSTDDGWTDEESISLDGDNSNMEIENGGPPDAIDGLEHSLVTILQQQNAGQPLNLNPEFSTNPEAESILTEADFEDYSMHPEILRVNKQVHDEASDVLFTEGIVVVNANDMFWLTNKYSKYGRRYGKNPWRRNPLTDTAKRLAGGTIEYTQGDVGGWMEPHVFAKFKKIHFDCALEDDHTENILFFLDIDTWKLDYEDARDFRSYLRTLTFIKDFVKLISKSKVINKLTINILLEIRVDTKLDSESVDSDDPDALMELDEKQNNADIEAHFRALDIFMDANMFKSFKYLKNVRNLDFRNGFDEYFPTKKYMPTEAQLMMIFNCKRMVERNFREPGEPTRRGLRSQGSVA
ncbi:hypothetical protein SBOR_6754 [Sclerotinia borealis F-4128]|uniref:F-box domain-containing protein n=1 Tax=Sclerotinia borealis (strain F-4128) TaxID=1432307 RepID=W9CAI5_SCLBF|nr:hypothetical protein SBOR_6754 [Sclerotinia borealis F-4128]